MLRIFGGLVAGMLSLPMGALAGNYSDAVDKQRKCESAGDVAKAFYGAGEEKFRSQIAQIDIKVKSKEISKKLGADTKYLIFIGSTANSPTDAYMQAWGWCMDQK